MQKGKAATSSPTTVRGPSQQNARELPSSQPRPDDFIQRQQQTFPVDNGQIPGPLQMQYRPQQPMSGAFPPVSGPSQGPGHFVFTPQQTGYSVGQPSHMYILRATPPPMNTIQQYSLSQNFGPRARERKLIRIKDSDSNKDVTQEIFKHQPSGSVSGIASGSTGGTPTNTPDISGQSSSSSTPPLSSQQQDVRAQFAAQVAATLSRDTDENFELTLEGSVGEEIVLKAPQSESAEVEERVNGHEAEAKTASVTKNSADVQRAGKDMKTKKQNKRLKEMAKQFSEKGVDLMGAYTEKPVNEEVDYGQISGPPQMQYRPQQPMAGAFPPVSGPSQGPGHFGYTPQQTIYPMGQPSGPLYILRAPATPMNTIQQYSPGQNFEPRARERKLIRMKDPDSNKDVTQEILNNRQPSGSVSGSASGSTGGTPTNTPDISGQSSSSSTPPLSSRQQDVRAQFAAQVAATLSRDTDENFELTLEGSVGEEIVLKAPQSESAEVEERVNGHEAEAKTASVTKTSTDVQRAGKDMKTKKQNKRLKEMAKRFSEKGMDLMGAYTEKPVNEEVDYGQISGPPQMQYRPQQPMAGAFPPVSGPSQGPGHFGYTPQQTIYPMGQPSGPLYILRAPATPMNTIQQYSPGQNFEPRARERKLIRMIDLDSNKDVTQEILNNRQPSGSVSGSASGSTGGTPTNTPDISGQSSSSSTPPLSSRQQDVRAQFAAQVAATLSRDTDENFELTLEGSVGEEIVLKAPQSESAEVEERVNGHEAEAKTASVTKTSTDVQRAGKDMKTKKQNKRLKEMAKQFSEKGMDLMGAYTEKPVNEEVDYGQISGPPQMQYRSQQPMAGAFPPVSGPSQGPGHFGYTPQQTIYPMGQPSGPLYILRAPATPMNTIQQYSPGQNFEPRARERKLIRMKDPDSNKDVTQEILNNRQPSGSVSGSASGSTGGTPTNTPDISGQSSSSSTPPLSSRQQNVRAQFAAQVAATLTSDTDKNKKPGDVIIQKPSVNNKLTVDAPKLKSVADTSKYYLSRQTEISANMTAATERKLAEQLLGKKLGKQVKEESKSRQPKKQDNQQVPKVELTLEGSVGEEIMLKAPQSESAEVEEMVNGYEAKAKTASVTKNSTDVPGAEASFPDLDEKPKKQDGGRLTYERDFLLQFQTHPMCMLKPEGLPDLEIVLRQARTPSRSRFSQNRMQPKDGGENIFLPAYLRQNSRQLKRTKKR